MVNLVLISMNVQPEVTGAMKIFRNVSTKLETSAAIVIVDIRQRLKILRYIIMRSLKISNQVF